MAEKYHFFKVPHETVTEEKYLKLAPSAKVLFTTLCRLANIYADEEGWFFRSMRDLANDSGLHYQTVIQSKKALIKSNYICCKRGVYESTNYRASDSYRINGFKLRLDTKK